MNKSTHNKKNTKSADLYSPKSQKRQTIEDHAEELDQLRSQRNELREILSSVATDMWEDLNRIDATDALFKSIHQMDRVIADGPYLTERRAFNNHIKQVKERLLANFVEEMKLNLDDEKKISYAITVILGHEDELDGAHKWNPYCVQDELGDVLSIERYMK
jgi:hypothetical protein